MKYKTFNEVLNELNKFPLNVSRYIKAIHKHIGKDATKKQFSYTLDNGYVLKGNGKGREIEIFLMKEGKIIVHTKNIC